MINWMRNIFNAQLNARAVPALENKLSATLMLATGGRLSSPFSSGEFIADMIAESRNSVYKNGEKAGHMKAVAEQQRRKPIATMSRDELSVLKAMTDGEFCPSFAGIAAVTLLPEKDVREIVRGFKRDGFATMGPLTDDEGKMRGRGYYLTAKGLEAQSVARELV